MSKELADALRRFADQIEQGKVVPGASQVAIVVASDSGDSRATYIGNKLPARDAGIFLLGLGVQRFVIGVETQTAAPVPAAAGFGSTRRSTH